MNISVPDDGAGFDRVRPVADASGADLLHSSVSGAESGRKRNYNLLVILDASPRDAEKSPVLQRFVDKIFQVGGTVTDVEVWGRRTAFLSGADDGVYVRVSATAPPAAVAALDRQITESGLRLHSSAVRA